MTGLQLAIMHVLWQRGEATVAEVQQALNPDRPLAHTTVATVLDRLAARGAVERIRVGRRRRYRPRVSRAATRRRSVKALVDDLFDGNAKALVTQLVRDGSITAGNLVRLGGMLED